MKPILTTLLIAIAVTCYAQYAQPAAGGKENLPVASITFRCDCRMNPEAIRVIAQKGGTEMSLDCSKGEDLVHSVIQPGFHSFGGMPIASTNEAIRYRISHLNNRTTEIGYLHYEDRATAFHLRVEPGDVIELEVVRVNGKP